ncbi:MAG: hypothetical protein AABN33_26755 [Acidobacteriota bacterium]
MAHELKQESVREAAGTERELGRGRTAARISQVVDYFFYLIYGLIALEFLLGLMGARSGNGFVQFIGAVTRPLLAPFERIVGTPSSGAFQVRISYLVNRRARSIRKIVTLVAQNARPINSAHSFFTADLVSLS